MNCAGMNMNKSIRQIAAALSGNSGHAKCGVRVVYVKLAAWCGRLVPADDTAIVRQVLSMYQDEDHITCPYQLLLCIRFNQR